MDQFPSLPEQRCLVLLLSRGIRGDRRRATPVSLVHSTGPKCFHRTRLDLRRSLLLRDDASTCMWSRVLRVDRLARLPFCATGVAGFPRLTRPASAGLDTRYHGTATMSERLYFLP